MNTADDETQYLPAAVENGTIRVVFRGPRGAPRSAGIERIQLLAGEKPQAIAHGLTGAEFSTTAGGADASRASAARLPDGSWGIDLSVSTDAFEATETILLPKQGSVVRREQTYRFRAESEVAIHPGFRLTGTDIRYTHPPYIYESPLRDVAPVGTIAAWAAPMPVHIWCTPRYVAVYGVDRTRSLGALYAEPGAGGSLVVRTCVPDANRAPPPEGLAAPDDRLDTMTVGAGQAVRVCEFLAATALGAGTDPLWEACRLASAVLLDERQEPDWARVASGIADFYARSDLWNPNALGAGRGFLANMWVHTQSGVATRSGDAAGYYDIGWGEGFHARSINALARHWKRTGRVDLLRYVDHMTYTTEQFRRPGPGSQPLYDRYHPPGSKSLLNLAVPGGFGDFLGHRRVWTHSAAAIGVELLDAYEAVPDYPERAVRRRWLDTARSIAHFLGNQQRDDGDVQDGFDERDAETNTHPNRIAARSIACGLWATLARLDGDPALLDRAGRLADRLAPDIHGCRFYNQMLDTHVPWLEGRDVADAEGAAYALEGLARLYAEKQDLATLACCRRCAAYLTTWMFFYDLPTGHKGHLRGGTVCRDDVRIVYPGAGAMAVRPLLALWRRTGDSLYRTVAREMLDCAAEFQWTEPGVPWFGGIIEAIDAHSGRHWGPNREGQVDGGMVSGMTLTALEIWLADQGQS